MRYRLALDIGTASCGLVAVSLDDGNEPLEVVHHGVYIFSEPVLPAKSGGVGEPKKASRRAARMARRVIDRRGRRLKRVAMLAQLIGLNHREIQADDGQNIHALRADAATHAIGLDDLIRVFLKLVKRRGYAGSFKTRKKGEDGVVEPGINQLREAMHAADADTGGKCKTLGQYLQHRFSRGETLRLKEVGLYSHRDMLVEEFNTIWATQAAHHAILNESRPDPIDPNRRERPIRDQFFDAIFYQRPLKSVAPMVGNCGLEPSLPRAPMAQPAMQQFRIEKQLADLRWGMGRNARPLSVEQKDLIRKLLCDPNKVLKDGKLKFTEIYKALEAAELRPEYPRTLNMERSSREELTGDRTSRVMRDLGVLEQWQAMDATAQLRIINFLADLGSPEQVDQEDWHERFTKTTKVKNTKTGRWEIKLVPRKLDEQVVAFINQLVEKEKFDRLGGMGLETGRASYSIRALQRLTDEMQQHSVDEHAAIQKLYPPEEPTGELLMQLPPHKSTGNVVVDVALRVVRRAVNEALAKLSSPPTEVVVELSRDMALGLKARGDIEAKINKNKKKRDNARKELEKNDLQATDRNILRYVLWEQQDAKHCPYCDRHITLSQATDGNETNFEHILPRSLTRVGKQRNHLVLAHRSCNDEKGDRTPFVAFGHDEERWRAVKYCATVLEANKQSAKARLLLLSEYEDEVLDEESIKDFSERQFAETSWIGKLTAQWLKAVCPRVDASRGTLTAHLRRIWKLETVIAQARFDAGLPVLDQDGTKVTLDDFKRFKPFWEGHQGREHARTDRKIEKRIDHRHHLIDALVIAMTSRSLFIRMAGHYKELAERRKAGEPVKMKLYSAPPLQNIREQALALVKSVEVRHKPDRYGGGAFFQMFAYGTTQDAENHKLLLRRRKSLPTLVGPKDSATKARGLLLDIESNEVRRLVLAEFDKRVNERGFSAFAALQHPIEYPSYRTQIRAATFLCGSAESASVIAHQSRTGMHKKVLIDDGWACLEVTAAGNSVTTKLVSPKSLEKSGRSAAEAEAVRIFKGDTLRDTKSGQLYVVRQIKSQYGGMLVMTPNVDARQVRDMSAVEGLKKVSGKGLLNLTRV